MRQDIREVVLEHGAKNVLIIIKMPVRMHLFGPISVNSGDYVETTCTIDEKQYKVVDGYKISVKPTNEEVFCGQDFYQSDFNSLWRQGQAQVFINVMKKEK